VRYPGATQIAPARRASSPDHGRGAALAAGSPLVEPFDRLGYRGADLDRPATHGAKRRRQTAPGGGAQTAVCVAGRAGRGRAAKAVSFDTALRPAPAIRDWSRRPDHSFAFPAPLAAPLAGVDGRLWVGGGGGVEIRFPTVRPPPHPTPPRTKEGNFFYHSISECSLLLAITLVSLSTSPPIHNSGYQYTDDSG
jgi:hypothetical protein